MTKVIVPASEWRNPKFERRVPELDGVRGLAILLVLIWHYCVFIYPPAPHSWQHYALMPFELSWSGVDLFFVLSGFLIGGILWDARDAKNFFQTFYLRRAHRILPLYFFWLVLFAIGLMVLPKPAAQPLQNLFNTSIPFWSYPFFLQNFFMAFGQTPGAEWLGITWSLAVEEQFYLLLPLAIRKLTAEQIVRVALGAMMAAPLLRVALQLAGNPYYGPYTLLPCRADALGLGVLLALACRNRNSWEWIASHRKQIRTLLVFLVLPTPVLSRFPKLMDSIGYTWLAALYGSLLLLAVVNPGKIEAWIFRDTPLRQMGIYAYALYMMHQGINALLHYAFFQRAPLIDDVGSLCLNLVSLVTVLLLAAASWKWAEEPLIRHAQKTYRYSMRPNVLVAEAQVVGALGQERA